MRKVLAKLYRYGGRVLGLVGCGLKKIPQVFSDSNKVRVLLLMNKLVAATETVG